MAIRTIRVLDIAQWSIVIAFAIIAIALIPVSPPLVFFLILAGYFVSLVPMAIVFTLPCEHRVVQLLMKEW